MSSDRKVSKARIVPDGESLLVECLDDEGDVVAVRSGTTKYDALSALTDECTCGASFHKLAKGED